MEAPAPSLGERARSNVRVALESRALGLAARVSDPPKLLRDFGSGQQSALVRRTYGGDELGIPGIYPRRRVLCTHEAEVQFWPSRPPGKETLPFQDLQRSEGTLAIARCFASGHRSQRFSTAPDRILHVP